MTQTNTKTFTMPFAGGHIDYAELQRTPEHLQKFIAQPNARAILLCKGRVALTDKKRLHRVHPSELIGHNMQAPGPIFLGLDGTRPIFAASLENPEEFLNEDEYYELRAAGGHMDPVDLATAGRARSLFDWHRMHRFCANCGAESYADDGGAKRMCNTCATQHFPRVNPVVIMLIIHKDSVLLGRAPGWPENWMSALAGFVSPGESVEEATYRETLEEVGIRTRNHRYVFSQPWPYPSQLMMGMICDADDSKIDINKAELEDARWFTRAEVQAVFDKTGEAFMRPPRITIAHQLLRHWLEE